MNDTGKWPVLHILVGVPIVLTISAIIGSALDGWSMSKWAVLYGATMATPVGMTYTFLIVAIERSYLMVFWAREKIKEQFREAREIAEARGEAIGEARGRAKSHKEWNAWYERFQIAQREGRPFDEPPPSLPETENDQ